MALGVCRVCSDGGKWAKTFGVKMGNISRSNWLRLAGWAKASRQWRSVSRSVLNDSNSMAISSDLIRIVLKWGDCLFQLINGNLRYMGFFTAGARHPTRGMHMPQTGLQHFGDGFMGNTTARHDIDRAPSAAHHFA